MTFIEVRHLKLLKTVTDTGNLTRAARHLFVTQPALSHQLSDIETKLEAPLFFRKNKRMVLTDAGKRLLGTANLVLEELKSAQRDICEMADGKMGVLKVGTTCMLAYTWLPSVLTRFQELHPLIEIEFHVTRDYQADLTSGKLDVVITSIEKHDRLVRSKTVFKDEIVVIMLPGHPLSEKEFISLEDFHGISLVSFTEPPKDEINEHYLMPAGIVPSKITKVEQPEAAIELVRSGFGLSLLPRWSVEQHLRSGELCARKLTAEGVYYEWKAAFLAKKVRASAQDEFIRLVVSHGRPMG